MADSDRPQLKSVQDLGMKPQKAPSQGTDKPKEGFTHRMKRWAGNATYLPAQQIGKYLTDAAEDAGKK